MDNIFFDEKMVGILRSHLATNRRTTKRPILVFACGGDPRKYHSRLRLQEYVKDNENDLKNIFFMSAENIAKEPSMKDLDLLAQEALISDVADWLVIFAESIGSFCELGAFAALPHAAAITSAVVDKKHEKSDSFLIKGPVTAIEDCKTPFSKTFYSNLECPMENSVFVEYVMKVRSLVQENEGKGLGKNRKKPNGKSRNILVGPFAHELLDLIVLFGPIDEKNLLKLYSDVKGFDWSTHKLVSNVLSRDMRKKYTILPIHVLATMLATGLIGKIEQDGNEPTLYYSKIELDDYFMFKETESSDFINMHAKVILRRRKKGGVHGKPLYRRFDSDGFGTEG